MKKLLFLGAVALASAGIGHMSTAHAAPVCVPGGCLGVNDAGYVVVGDGDASNPDPADGYAGITGGGSFDCGDEGGPYSGTPVTPGCNPSAP